MKRDNIFSIIVMSCGALLILSVFLPYVSYFSTTVSLWKIEDPSRIIYIVLGLLVIAVYLANKKTELAYLAAGYGTFSTLGTIMSLGGFSGLSLAFYVLMLSSITIGVLTFLYNEEAADALINFSVSVNEPAVNENSTNTSVEIDNNPTMNVQEEPVTQMVEEPIVRTQEEPVMQMPEEPMISTPLQNDFNGLENRPVRFDPMTGEPINTENN